MRLITIDFETFWSATHSLTKMNPVEYVMHGDTEVQSISIKNGDEPAYVLFGEDAIQDWADNTDFSDVLLIAHNMSEFDCMIASWVFGIDPKMWGCTLAMSRPFYGKTAGGSLKALSEMLGIGHKLSLEATNTKGKRLKDFTKDEIEAMRVYNNVDTELCYGIFKKLAPVTPKREMKLIDLTIRMLVNTQFEADVTLLKRALLTKRQEVRNALRAVASEVVPMAELLEEGDMLEAVKKELASAAKFSKFLESRGVEVPMKESPSTPGKMIPALAKSDKGFTALTEHSDPAVAAVAQARLGVKSTLLEGRLSSFIIVSEYLNGYMPIPLRYYGALTTGRWSGTMKLNMQNMPRVDPSDPKISDALRNCLTAPPGYKVVVADLSGIELRVNHFLWRVERSMQAFIDAPGEADLYKDFAADFYSVKFSEVTKPQRQVGKAAHLGLGFSAGAKTFREFSRVAAGVKLEPEEAERVVASWRSTYPEIVDGWKRCQAALGHIARGESGRFIDDWGLCEITPAGIKTPRSTIRYPDLRQELVDGDYGPRKEWTYGHGRHQARIYGGKVTENIVQCLARDIIAGMMLDVTKTELGRMYKPALTVHDELVYVVRDEHAQVMLDTVQGIMRAGVSWWPELVTWSEGDIADNYGEAK